MSVGWPQLLVIAILVLILFGRGRISEMMGDFGRGISSFKKGMSEEASSTDAPAAPAPSARIEGPAHEAKPAGETVESAAPRDTTSN